MKKKIAGFLAATFIVSLSPCVAFAAEFSDMPNDWSKPALEAAVSNGLLKGDNGKISPNEFLTRAEMATIVNRAFGATEEASILSNFTDVSSNAAWYYDDMAKAVQMQVFQGSGNKLHPNDNITREQAFIVLARAFKSPAADSNVLDKFSDKNSISSWAKDSVASLVSAGYVSGSNGQLNPKQNITRAEFAQIMNSLVKTYIQKADTYSQDTTGNVMVNVPGTTLKNMTITGNLIIGDGVGNGEVTLDHVMVTGTTIVRGGGVHSVKIIGNSNIKNIVIARVNGEVRVYAENGTQVGTVVVDGKDDVIIEGKVGEVKVEASDITVTATNASIETATVNGDQSKIIANTSTTIKTLTVNAKNSEVVAEKGATIQTIVANQEGVKVNGSGTVNTVTANANNIVVNTSSTSVTAASGTTGVMAGSNKVEAGKTASTSGTTSGGGGGHSGSSTVAVSDVTITGNAVVGQTLTVVPTPSNATVSYQWMRCDTAAGTCTNIAGATSSTYVLTNNDKEKYIKVVVSGTGSYTGTKTSAATAAVTVSSKM